MERDFMGLNSEDPILIKEESVEQGSGFARTSGMPWQWLNNPSSMLFLNCDRDGKSSKINCGGDTNMKQQFLAGLSAPEKWKNNFKASTTTPQLTIFYGGTVSVFDDITPEKAQAIILLAGNGCATSNISQLKLHMQTAASKFPSNPSMNKQPPTDPTCPVDHSVSTADFMTSMTAGMPTSVVNKVDSPRMISPITPAAASAMISSAVPQSRKASLARFLEKRKERAASVAPYNPSKSAAEYATPVK